MNGLGSRRRVLLVSALVTEGLIVAALASAVVLLDGFRASSLVLGLAACFVPYAAVLFCARSLSAGSSMRVALVWLAVFGSALLFVPPVLSDDVFRFVWEGNLWLEGLNPYRLPPADPSLEHLRDEVWTGINNKHLASIYPPLSQALFVAVAVLGGGVFTVKLLALVAHAATVAVVTKITRDPRAPLAIGLNPLLLSAGALDGHLDILTGLALIVAAWALSRQRIGEAVAATLTAVGLKVVGLVWIPLFVRRPMALASLVLLSAVLLLPMALFGPSSELVSGPVQFASTWQGNDSAYAVVEWTFTQVLQGAMVERASRMAVGATVLVIALVLGVWRVPPLRAARVVLWATLLLSPQVHPWYLAWLLPLEVVVGGLAGLVWSGAVLCAYAPIDRWLEEGVWQMPNGLLFLEYSLVALAFLVEAWRSQGGDRSMR